MQNLQRSLFAQKEFSQMKTKSDPFANESFSPYKFVPSHIPFLLCAVLMQERHFTVQRFTKCPRHPQQQRFRAAPKPCAYANGTLPVASIQRSGGSKCPWRRSPCTSHWTPCPHLSPFAKQKCGEAMWFLSFVSKLI